MNDEEMKILFRRLAGMYKMECETAKILLQKILNTLYGEEREADTV